MCRIMKFLLYEYGGKRILSFMYVCMYVYVHNRVNVCEYFVALATIICVYLHIYLVMFSIY